MKKMIVAVLFGFMLGSTSLPQKGYAMLAALIVESRVTGAMQKLTDEIDARLSVLYGKVDIKYTPLPKGKDLMRQEK